MLYNTAFYQNALADCSGEDQALNYDSTTGILTCSSDDGFGAPTNLWSTTTNNLAIHPINTSYAVVIGADATTTDAKLEVNGEVASAFITAGATGTSTLPYTSILGLALNGDYVTDFVGTGLLLTGGILSVDTTGDWTGTFDGQEGTWYIANSFSTTSANYWETQQTPRTADDLSDNYLSDLGNVSYNFV